MESHSKFTLRCDDANPQRERMPSIQGRIDEAWPKEER